MATVNFAYRFSAGDVARASEVMANFDVIANAINNGLGSSNIAAGSISNTHINASASIDATKIFDGTVSNAEFKYLDGVTSAIQTQLNTLTSVKVPQTRTLTAGTGLTGGGDLSADRTFSLDATGVAEGHLANDAVSSRTIQNDAVLTAHLSDEAVTAPKTGPTPTRTITAAATLAAGDYMGVVLSDVASAHNITVPTNASVAFPVGTVIVLTQMGAGTPAIVAATGVTLLAPGGTAITGQYLSATLLKTATDTWLVSGAIA